MTWICVSDAERLVIRYDFENGAYVTVIIGGTVETEKALNIVEELISLKRRELVALSNTSGSPS